MSIFSGVKIIAGGLALTYLLATLYHVWHRHITTVVDLLAYVALYLTLALVAHLCERRRA